jgi:hypothetical protein
MSRGIWFGHFKIQNVAQFDRFYEGRGLFALQAAIGLWRKRSDHRYRVWPATTQGNLRLSGLCRGLSPLLSAVKIAASGEGTRTGTHAVASRALALHQVAHRRRVSLPATRGAHATRIQRRGNGAVAGRTGCFHLPDGRQHVGGECIGGGPVRGGTLGASLLPTSSISRVSAAME